MDPSNFMDGVGAAASALAHVHINIKMIASGGPPCSPPAVPGIRRHARRLGRSMRLPGTR